MAGDGILATASSGAPGQGPNNNDRETDQVPNKKPEQVHDAIYQLQNIHDRGKKPRKDENRSKKNKNDKGEKQRNRKQKHKT